MKYSMKNISKFIGMSFIGIFVFFINITINGRSTIFVNHLGNFITDGLNVILPSLILIISTISIIDIIIKREKYFKNFILGFLALTKVVGLIFIAFVVFDFGPKFLLNENIGPFILNKLLVPIAINVPIAALFLPFLLDYGLVDFIGVLVRPFMRPVYKTPGRAAVIAVSAFLGNFSVAHIAIDGMYSEGKLTQKEAVIIATGFSTCSIGFLIVLANTLGLMEHWNFYFWSTLIITFIVTFFTVRIWPIRKKSDKYFPGVEPKPEATFKKDLFKNAIHTGLKTSEDSKPLLKRLLFIGKESIIIVSGLLCAAMFFASIGLFINANTMFFTYLGYIYYPFLWLVQVPDLMLAVKATGVSFLEVFLPAIITSSGNAAIQTRYLVGVLPISMVIFLAGFIPCILSTKIPVKINELIVLWIERVILTIILAGIAALIYF